MLPEEETLLLSSEVSPSRSVRPDAFNSVRRASHPLYGSGLKMRVGLYRCEDGLQSNISSADARLPGSDASSSMYEDKMLE